ncbi:MAG TPA: hypothetical protein VLA41_08665 [Burkholderiales bacterium]|nr:hypothetical protein [Burkholderiales bacterium]
MARGKPSDAVVICDWLPPDFGAVGQYALRFARRDVAQGQTIVLVGMSRAATSVLEEPIGERTLTLVRMRASPTPRDALLRRALWTVATNVRLVWHALPYLRATREVAFTGSPPFLVHLLVPLARLLGIRTRYRITDFFPECLMATYARVPAWLNALYGLTNYWRRRVDCYEALGEDQKVRLEEIGIPAARIAVVPNDSPIAFGSEVRPAPRPPALRDVPVVLYSGNYGVAHEVETFIAGWRRYNEMHAAPVGLWLNAIGAGADAVDAMAAALPFPYARTPPVALDALAGVLLAADIHLITLRDAFVGYVLPSKVYACVDSGKPILFVGSARSDVHRVCARSVPAERYRRVEVGDVAGVTDALAALLRAAARTERDARMAPSRESGSRP